MVDEFRDPPIVGGKVNGAVHGRSCRWCRMLRGVPWIVQPAVRSLLQPLGQGKLIADHDRHIFIFLAQVDEMIEFIDRGIVHRIRLAGPDELYGIFRVAGELVEPFEIPGKENLPVCNRQNAWPRR